MKLIGILIILNSLVATSYWVVTHGTHKGTVITLCLIGIFTGAFFLLIDRITELSLPGVGTIKAATKQAIEDASEVSKLKKRVKDQSATVDLVAKEAAEAKQLVDVLSTKNSEAEEKLSQLDKSINDGNLAVKELQLYSQFNSTILDAQNDSRTAYDQLWAWSKDDSFLFQEAATLTIRTILGQQEPPIIIGNTRISADNAGKQLLLSQLTIMMQGGQPSVRRHVLEFVWQKRTDIPKKDRLEFLIDAIRNDESLLVVEYAGRCFKDGTGNKIRPLAIEQHLEWWKENKDSIE